MNLAINAPVRSKHALIAQALSTEIQSGKYRIGDLLPSEPDLSVAFGVSRHTVRVALRTLQSLGLVVSQQGVGTQVNSDRLVSRYNYSFDTAGDLLQYAAKTKVLVIGTQEVAVDAKLASYLQCKPGEHWWHIRTLRSEPQGLTVIAYSDIYIPLAFGAILGDVAKGKKPAFSLIEERFHESITEIRQDIGAISMTASEASCLAARKGSSALEITRRYIGRSGRIIEVARSVHPANSFKYSMHLKLQHGE